MEEYGDDVEMMKMLEIKLMYLLCVLLLECLDVEILELKMFELIKLGVRVDGGYFTSSGRVVGSALKLGLLKLKMLNEFKFVVFIFGEIV